MKQYVRGMPAKELLRIRIAEIEKLTAIIQAETKRWETIKCDWGVVGSTGHVVEQLEEIVTFIGVIPTEEN